MKRITKIAGVLLALCAMGSLFASGKKDEQKELKAGALSFLNLSEKDYATVLNERKDIYMKKKNLSKIILIFAIITIILGFSFAIYAN